MDNPSLSLKAEEGEEAIILRSRPPMKNLSNIEEVDSIYKEMILTLPKEEGWLAFPMRYYKGFWLSERFLSSIIAMEEAFQPRPSDVIVASFMKSGTTWLKALTFTVMHRNIDPKDVLVSLWHMITRYEGLNKSFPFTQAFELFCEGRMPYGPVWDQALEYYIKSLHSHEKILFLKYEEMMKDPVSGVMTLAKFIGCPFSEEEIQNGLVEEIVEFCSFNKLKDLDINKNGGIGNDVQNDFFFRKAVVGDWQTHMTPEMAVMLDKITKEKLHSSGLTF